MQYEYSYVMEEGADVLISLLSGLPTTMLGLAGYVLTALALYTLAQRRGIKNPWLAWIPVASCWIVGSLSDQYRYVAKGEIKSKRIALLVLNIVMIALVIAVIVCCIAAAVTASMTFRPEMAGYVIVICCLALALSGVSIACTVVRYIALNDIFHSMDPENSTLFLVLSIIFSITEPFFLFFNRNKDLGMPPRRETMLQPPVEEAAWQQPQQEPWNEV